MELNPFIYCNYRLAKAENGQNQRSTLWESAVYMEFTLKYIIYFIICKLSDNLAFDFFGKSLSLFPLWRTDLQIKYSYLAVFFFSFYHFEYIFSFCWEIMDIFEVPLYVMSFLFSSFKILFLSLIFENLILMYLGEDFSLFSFVFVGKYSTYSTV